MIKSSVTNENMQKVLKALRDNVEGDYHHEGKWGSVYLDNAKPRDMTYHQFAGYLGALEKAGFYKPQGDDCFGYVLLEGSNE